MTTTETPGIKKAQALINSITILLALVPIAAVLLDNWFKLIGPEAGFRSLAYFIRTIVLYFGPFLLFVIGTSMLETAPLKRIGWFWAGALLETVFFFLPFTELDKINILVLIIYWTYCAVATMFAAIIAMLHLLKDQAEAVSETLKPIIARTDKAIELAEQNIGKTSTAA